MKVGRILEYGLLNSIWLDVRSQEVVKVVEPVVLDEDLSEQEDIAEPENNDMAIGIMLMCCILLVWGNLAWLVFADKRGEG